MSTEPRAITLTETVPAGELTPNHIGCTVIIETPGGVVVKDTLRGIRAESSSANGGVITFTADGPVVDAISRLSIHLEFEHVSARQPVSTVFSFTNGPSSFAVDAAATVTIEHLAAVDEPGSENGAL